MTYRNLEHATDAFIEVHASNLEEAFVKAGEAVVDTTLNRSSVYEKEPREITVSGKNLRYLLFNWIEEVNFQLITEGFAIARFEVKINHNDEYKINARIWGEALDLSKHQFKVEIKAPTFHEMEIIEADKIMMRFLMDL